MIYVFNSGLTPQAHHHTLHCTIVQLNNDLVPMSSSVILCRQLWRIKHGNIFGVDLELSAPRRKVFPADNDEGDEDVKNPCDNTERLLITDTEKSARVIGTSKNHDEREQNPQCSKSNPSVKYLVTKKIGSEGEEEYGNKYERSEPDITNKVETCKRTRLST